LLQAWLGGYLTLVADTSRLLGLRHSKLPLVTTPVLSEAAVFKQQPRAGFTALDTDVRTMRRLRVTAGVYLPADTPIHGMFGSKDVIHSWAIPGLGLKIDCIPGYSSHRRLVLRWRGAY
jgi:heme/copper-type cytochrome/quinol oxidase subunit 2